jgi:hypothetical protein
MRIQSQKDDRVASIARVKKSRDRRPTAIRATCARLLRHWGRSLPICIRANNLPSGSCAQITPTTGARTKLVDASLPFYCSQAGGANTMRPGGGFLARHRVASIPMRLDTNRQNRARARRLGEAERRTDDDKGWCRATRAGKEGVARRSRTTRSSHPLLPALAP